MLNAIACAPTTSSAWPPDLPPAPSTANPMSPLKSPPDQAVVVTRADAVQQPNAVALQLNVGAESNAGHEHPVRRELTGPFVVDTVPGRGRDRATGNPVVDQAGRAHIVTSAEGEQHLAGGLQHRTAAGPGRPQHAGGRATAAGVATAAGLAFGPAAAARGRCDAALGVQHPVCGLRLRHLLRRPVVDDPPVLGTGVVGRWCRRSRAGHDQRGRRQGAAG